MLQRAQDVRKHRQIVRTERDLLVEAPGAGKGVGIRDVHGEKRNLLRTELLGQIHQRGHFPVVGALDRDADTDVRAQPDSRPDTRADVLERVQTPDGLVGPRAGTVQ